MIRTILVQAKRELGAILFSPIAYVLLVCFTLLHGFSFTLCVEAMQQGVKNVTLMFVFFNWFFFWFALILFVPILTMRLFSEEFKSGTVETLLTAPVGEWDVVLAKFIAAFLFYVLLWVPSALFYAVYQVITANAVPVQWGPLLLGYLMVLLIGAFYISIGLFASSLTRNQVVSAVLSFAGIALLFFCSFLGFFTVNPNLEELINYISSLNHM
ncbi:MAG: ABC transporter permease, partial [Verrucomicrobiia bacterium]